MITETTINNSAAGFNTYTVNPNSAATYEGMDLSDWKAYCAENGYKVEENEDIDGRVEGQDNGKVFKLSMSEDEYVNVVIWESAD